MHQRPLTVKLRGRTEAPAKPKALHRPLQRMLDNTRPSVPSIIVLHERFRRDQSPSALDQILQVPHPERGKAHQDPRVVSVVIRYEEDTRRGLHENMAIQKIRAQDEAVNALMYPSKQLAADLESWSTV